jgi:hypothetical protein
VTGFTRFMAGEVFSAVSMEWLLPLLLLLFIFPGFIVLAGIAIRNERAEDKRQRAEFDRMVLSLLKSSLSTASLDRRRPLSDVVIALGLRHGRPRLLFQRRDRREGIGNAGRKLMTFIYAYHYVRSPVFQLGGVHPHRVRTERQIRKFVFEQKWHVPVFLAREES